MSVSRLTAAILAELNGHLLVIDDRQPVALLLGPDGRIRSVASWPEVPPPPQPFDADRRRVVQVRRGRARVTDEPAGPSVVLSIRGGVLTAEHQDEDLADWEPPHAAHLFRRIRRVDHDGTEWTFRGRHAWPRVDAVVSRTRRGGEVRHWDLGTGSVSDALVLDGVAYVCVRRANKRPWEFDPARDLWRIVDDEPERLDVGIDISDRCWPPRPYLVEELARAFDRLHGDVQTAVEHGATDIRVVVEDLDRLPRIKLYFTLAGGRRYVRTDEPFDELGCATGGLSAFTIILDEDLRTGLESAQAAMDGLIPV